MGCPQSKKKKNPNNTKGYKSKFKTRCIDQVHDDLKAPEKFAVMPRDEDLPGDGQFYCIPGARYLQQQAAIDKHNETRPHRRRIKMALEDPHTQSSAEAAVGYSIAR